MASSAIIPQGHMQVSFDDVHHGSEHELEEVQEDITIPLLSSPVPSIGSHGSHQSRVSTSTSRYITEPLPEETLDYCTGVPLLAHYRMVDNAVVSYGHRYSIPTAAKSIYIRGDDELIMRKTRLLKIFDECFPGNAYRYGQKAYIKSFVYDFFPGLEKKVDDILCPLQITFYIGDEERVGYFLNPPDYQALYMMLTDYRMKWQKVVWEITGQSLLVPQWALEDMPARVWSAGEFEMFAIKYREELETFLYLIYKHRNALSSSHNANNPSMSRRQTQDQIRIYRAGQEAVARAGGIPEHNMENEGFEEADVTFSGPMRQVTGTIATTTAHQDRSHVEAPSRQRGYTNNPARLSSSRRLSELVGSQPSDFYTSTPARGPGPNLARQVPRQFQHHDAATSMAQVPQAEFVGISGNRSRTLPIPTYQNSFFRGPSEHNPRQPPRISQEGLAHNQSRRGNSQDRTFLGGNNGYNTPVRNRFGNGPPDGDPPDDPPSSPQIWVCLSSIYRHK